MLNEEDEEAGEPAAKDVSAGLFVPPVEVEVDDEDVVEEREDERAAAKDENAYEGGTSCACANVD